jgi:hypothetical protein
MEEYRENGVIYKEKGNEEIKGGKKIEKGLILNRGKKH